MPFGPLQIAENGWILGPYPSKPREARKQVQIGGSEPRAEGGVVSVNVFGIGLALQAITFRGKPMWVYTNAIIKTDMDRKILSEATEFAIEQAEKEKDEKGEA